MRNISPFVLITLLLQAPTIFTSVIPCPLLWEAHFGPEKMPENPIGPISGAPDTSQFASRVWNSERSEFHGGWMQKSVSYYPLDESRAAFSGDYDLLTNPHQCLIKWVDNFDQKPEDDDKLTPIEGPEGRKVVGRALIGNVIYFGEVIDGTLRVSMGSTSTTRLTRYQLLHSYGKGLHLELNHFTLLNDGVTGRIDVLGQDEIYNLSDQVELRQWIRVSNKVSEETTITQENYSRSLSSMKVTLDFSVKIWYALTIPIGGVGFFVGWEDEEFKNSTVTYGSEREFYLLREVIVPPGTSVLATSQIVMIENFESKYDAIGQYSAPGLTSSQIARILREDGILGEEDPVRNIVTAQMRGTIGGTLATFNEFNIEPIF